MKPDKSQTCEKDSSTATNANFHVIITTQDQGNSGQIERDNGTSSEFDNVFANERDASCCGSSDKHDYALDSTYHSVG